MSVRRTRKPLWLMRRRSSLLFQPGIQILNKRIRLRKNSLFSSTFFRPPVVLPSLSPFRPAARRCCSAAFCSLMALRIRFSKVTKRPMYMAREMRVRCLRYSVVRSDTAFLSVPSDTMPPGRDSFDCTAMSQSRPSACIVDDTLFLYKRLD